MKLTIISLISIAFGVLLCWGCLKTAQGIAKIQTDRVEAVENF